MGSMQWMKSRAAIAAIGLIPATVILASACSSGAGRGNKAGPVDQPVVLRMADLNAGTDLRGTPEIQYFVQRVSDLSRGKMSVKVAYSVGGLAMNAEQQVVKDVADGSFDLGFAGTSVFDTLGVPSFQALSAPMLIDSYPLENAVIRSSLPAKMMAGLAKLDVTGLAVLGDEHAQAGRGAAAHPESWPTGGASRSGPTSQRPRKPPSALWGQSQARDSRPPGIRPSPAVPCRAST